MWGPHDVNEWVRARMGSSASREKSSSELEKSLGANRSVGQDVRLPNARMLPEGRVTGPLRTWPELTQHNGGEKVRPAR